MSFIRRTLGPFSGFNVQDPSNTQIAADQIEGVVLNDVKADQHVNPFVNCPQSSPNEYACTISYGSGGRTTYEYVDVTVNTADGSLIATCVDQNGNNLDCAGEF